MPVLDLNLIVVGCVNRKQKEIISSFSAVFYIQNPKRLSPAAVLGGGCHVGSVAVHGGSRYITDRSCGTVSSVLASVEMSLDPWVFSFSSLNLEELNILFKLE